MMNSIEEINEAIDNHDQRGIELDWSQQKALLYNFRALIKSKDSGMDERDAEVARLRAVLEVMLASAYPHPTEHPTMTAAWAHAKAALATPPTAAVKAVEGMRKALEVMSAYLKGPVEFEEAAPELYELWLSEQEGLNPGGYLRLYVDAALAAYEEATRGR